MPPIRIVGDSTCDLSPELLEEYHIDIVPLYVNLGGKIYRDTGEITSEKIYEYVKETGVLPGTVGSSVGDFTECFKGLREQGFEVVCVTISADMSCTYQNAKIAAEEVGGVYVVDSRNLSSGNGHVVLNAAIMARSGMSAQEIARELEQITPKVRASFILDNLDYMKKGGRCSSVTLLGANMLKIKPTIFVEGGNMKVGQKFRGLLIRVLEEYVDAQLGGRKDIRTDRIFITHTGNIREQVEIVRARIEQHLHFDAITETHAGATITSHCGPNTLGILFIEK
ncbi:MAG: DegV family protein [Clostridia bacterium]|nr:DegV family protein [Clostridia bacterium]